MVTRPKVLFADEPTGALDSASYAKRHLAILRDLVSRRGQTIIMVTHDPIAAAAAGRVIFLADGRLVGELLDPTAETVAGRLATLEAAAC